MTIFGDKLDLLPTTASLTLNLDVTALARHLRDSRDGHSVAVGSGGSAVAAEYLRLCRSTLGRGRTSVETPLEFTLGLSHLHDTDVWLFSAGGDNYDILAALTAASQRAARTIIIVTSNPAARLIDESAALENVLVLVTPRAEPKDGFLATHSLLGCLVALLRASAIAASRAEPPMLAGEITAILEQRLGPIGRQSWSDALAEFKHAGLLFVLHDPRLRAAAILLETSLWEAAVIPVQLADFRNFAHGRHVWLSGRGDAAILALTGSETRPMWEQIDAVLPSRVSRVWRDFGRCARIDCFAAIIDGFVAIEALADFKDIDPACPRIGEFAREIYDSDALATLAGGLVPPVRQKRFIRALDDQLGVSDGDLGAAHRGLLERLSSADFGAVVLDYDGTIVATEKRYEPPSRTVVDRLIELLDAGLRFGIATGRGGSAGEDLRDILPSGHHGQILMGYYNGALVCPLSQNIKEEPPAMKPAIRNALAWLRSRSDLISGDIKDSPLQVTIHRDKIVSEDAFLAAFSAAQFEGRAELKLVESRHSFDLCLVDACKTNVVNVLQSEIGTALDVLCIGDRGDAAGNDHAMLGLPFGISVDHVCSREHVGWSLFGAECSGPDALLRILRALNGAAGSFRIDLASLERQADHEYKTRTSA